MLSRVIAKNVGDIFWDTVYILLATCSKYSIDITDMSENIIKQTITLTL